MQKRLVVVMMLASAILLGCERRREIQILLGPTSDTLTIGFRCVQDADPPRPLFARAVSGEEVRFNLVVDVVTLGEGFPGCRGEELMRTCDAGMCMIPSHRDGGPRFCLPVAIPTSIVNSEPLLLAALRDRLEGQTIVTNAADGPVLVRAVATTEPCATLVEPLADTTYPKLDGALALGCAYSCPLVLDDVVGPISLSIDALTNRCEQVVRVCASLP